MHAQLSIRLDNRSIVAWDTRKAGVGGYVSRLNNRWCRPPSAVLFECEGQSRSDTDTAAIQIDNSAEEYQSYASIKRH